jgi:hypothetical protein
LQGLVAELVDFEADAADLYRHSAHLEPTPFGVTLFVDWTARFLLNEYKLKPNDYWFNVLRLDVLTLSGDLLTRIER